MTFMVSGVFFASGVPSTRMTWGTWCHQASRKVDHVVARKMESRGWSATLKDDVCVLEKYGRFWAGSYLFVPSNWKPPGMHVEL